MKYLKLLTHFRSNQNVGLITILFFVLSACWGKKTGKYDNEGDFKAVGEIINGEKEGVWCYFDANGDTMQIINFKKGIKHGECLDYSKGKLKVSQYYKNGIRDGEYKYYFENGSIETKGMIRDGKQTGPWESYHKNGSLLNTFNMLKGKPVGPFTVFYKNGNIYMNGQDSKNGIVEYYDSLGNLGGKFLWTNGKISDTLEYNFSVSVPEG